MRQLHGHRSSVRALAYAPDGHFLASGDEGGVVCLWSLPSGERARQVGTAHGSVEALAFSPRGDSLSIAAADALLGLNVAEQGEGSVRLAVAPLACGSRGLAWHPTDDLLVSGSWDSRIRFWAGKWAPAREPLSHPAPVTALAFGGEGGSLAVVTPSGLVTVLDSRTGRPRWQSLQPRGSYAVAVSRENVLATGETNGDVLLWRLEDGSPLGKLTGHTWTVYGLAFTPDGRRLVSGSADGTVRVWEPAAGRSCETFRWHGQWVTAVAVSPDGMTAAAASADQSVVVWDLADG